MGEDNGLGPDGHRLAERFLERAPQVLGACRSRLVSAANTVALDEASRAQMMRNCEQILADVVSSLRAGRVCVDDEYLLLARDIGAARAADNVHPGESLQAGSVFYEAVLAEARDLVAAEPNALELFTLVACALETSISQRVREAFAVYTSFLLNKVHEAQVNERHRIARELHDRLGHSLSVTHRQLELFDVYRDGDPERAAAKVEAARTANQEGMASLRTVASGLFSPEPVKSLEKALINDLDGVDAGGTDVRVSVNGDEAWARPPVLDEAFLILREAARNALRHSRAAIVLVNVDITPHEIRGTVEDNGVGFDAANPPPSGGVGVSTMRERAELLGGGLVIRSRIGSGTHVQFTARL